VEKIPGEIPSEGGVLLPQQLPGAAQKLEAEFIKQVLGKIQGQPIRVAEPVGQAPGEEKAKNERTQKSVNNMVQALFSAIDRNRFDKARRITNQLSREVAGDLELVKSYCEQVSQLSEDQKVESYSTLAALITFMQYRGDPKSKQIEDLRSRYGAGTAFGAWMNKNLGIGR
jgi:hypothetical protein